MTVRECPPTDPPGGDRAPARTAWPVVLVTVLSGVAVAFQIGKIIAALPTVSADLAISLTLGGALLGAFTVVSALCGVALGSLVNRVGPLSTLVGGLLLVAAGAILGGLTTGGMQLLATTALEGAGYVAVVVAAPTLIARAVAPADSGLALGIWGMYMPAGQATMAAAAPVLLGAWGWRGMWFANASLLLASAAAVWLVLSRSDLRDRPGTPVATGRGAFRRTLVAALRRPAPRTLALTFGVYTLLFSVTGFLPTVYTAQGLDTTAATTLTGVVIVMNALGNLAAGLLLRRGARFWVLIFVAATVMGTAAVGVFTLAVPFAVAYACAVVMALFGGLLPASVLAAVPALVDDHALVPVTNGLIVQAIGVGMVIGPIAAGALADRVGGWHATPLVATTAAVLAVLLALRVRRIEQAAAR